MKRFSAFLGVVLDKLGLRMRAKLMVIFLIIKVIPLLVLVSLAVSQIVKLSADLRQMAVEDSSRALNDSAVESIERITTDTAARVADFLYQRDYDILYLATLPPSDEAYQAFSSSKMGRLLEKGHWVLSQDESLWTPLLALEERSLTGGGLSTNSENEADGRFHYREPDQFTTVEVPLYDEVTYLDLTGQEIFKVVNSASTKINYPLSSEKRDVSLKENTYVRAEGYFEALQALKPGEIYVSDVIGAYVGSNYIGMYTPGAVSAAAQSAGYDIEYDPKAQAYAGEENPNGQRFEGIVRWATPVADTRGRVVGYVTMALNHDHIMEFVDHQTPMSERYTQLPSAFEGNYAFIWDYNCRSICHPRHHSIVGFNPETGNPEIPWLEKSIYAGWQASGLESWTDYVQRLPLFDNQSRNKVPAAALTQAGLVGLDGRWLNNAPQCTGWMDLTKDGGSGSFIIRWSGLDKLTTAAAIPYYTGQYAPTEANGFSRRGFGFVAVGAGLDDFTHPAQATEASLTQTINENLTKTYVQLGATTALIILLVVLIAILLASWLSNNINLLIAGISRFRAGERHFRFSAVSQDEFGELAASFNDMADSVVSSVSNPLSITDLRLNIIYMNESALKLAQKELEEVLGASYIKHSVYPVGSQFCPITALSESREAEIFSLKEQGIYLRGTANYLLDKKGGRIGYIVETTNMTEMVLEQQKLERERAVLDRIFSNSPDLIWLLDADRRFVTVNPKFAQLGQLPPEAFVGKRVEEVLPHLADDIASSDKQAMQQQMPYFTEKEFEFANGEVKMLDAVRTPLFRGDTLIGLLGFARDTSIRARIEAELRATQLELEAAVETANRANEHKGEFLARMSHEIRTPMNAIQGITNIVQRKLTDIHDKNSELADVKVHIGQIESSAQHLLGLLNDILDITKIEAGKIEITEETVELGKLMETVVGIIKPRCEEKNISFIVEAEDFAGGAFISDSLRLRQVLINLLGNAVKFTPELGKIHLGMQRVDHHEGETLVRFSVCDTGIGIAPEKQTSIFQPFEQGGSQVSRQYGGTGLGLAISQRIVQRFGGEIVIQSEPGQGSEFSFSLWLRETECEQSVMEDISDITNLFVGKTALLVDDVEINRMIIQSLLETTGINIDEAVDGTEAVKSFQSSPPGKYDIILMDILMPNMDGYEATRIIRDSDRADAASVPIVALTANAFKDDIKRAKDCGMNAHLSKPIEMDKLTEVLVRYLGKHQASDNRKS